MNDGGGISKRYVLPGQSLGRGSKEVKILNLYTFLYYKGVSFRYTLMKQSNYSNGYVNTNNNEIE